MARTGRTGRWQYARQGGAVFLASVLSNLLALASLAILARGQDPADFGEITTALNLLLIASVPAIAIQLVLARHVAMGRPLEAALSPRLVVGLAVLVFVVTVAVGLALSSLLALSGPLIVLPMALTGTILTGIAAMQGLTLGAQRYYVFAALVLVFPTARLLSAAVSALGSEPATYFLALAGLVVVAFGVAAWAVDAGGWWKARGRSGDLKEVLFASGAFGGFTVLASLDLILARALLPAVASGEYAAGTLFTRAALWGPQAVALLLYPRLARQGSSVILWGGSAVLVLLGGVGAMFAAVFGETLVTIAAGNTYTPVAPTLPAFVALGTGMAVLQLLLMDGTARASRATPYLPWLTSGLLVGLVLGIRPTTVTGIVGLATLTTMGVATLALLAGARSGRRRTVGRP